MARSVSVRRLVIAALVLIFPSVALAQTIYVNNVRGRDQCDGSLEVPTDVRTGPVRTLHRALKLAGPSDTIQITNTGRPYDSDIRLFGTRHSGLPGLPFRIVGNGAVITGRRPIPPLAWRRLDALWTLAPRRKGYYLFLRDGKLLPRHPLTGTHPDRTLIPEGHWSAWQGRIYYRADTVGHLDHQNLAIAGGDCGLTLHAVHHVAIENLVFQHWRLDGISAPNLCRSVLLKNVTCRENGRSGLTVSGTSQVRGEGIRLIGNGHHSLLLEGLGVADLRDATISQPPTLSD